MNKTSDLDAIKEQLTYCVLNAIRNESDPTDDRLKEIIADVISNTATVKMSLSEKRDMAKRSVLKY